MNQTHAYNQGAFVAPLPAPNNAGVCFSLSIHWLTNDYEPVMIDSIASAAQEAYAVGSENRVNLIQNAANLFTEGVIDMNMLVGYVIQYYPAIQNAAPSPAMPATITPLQNMLNAMNAALYDDNIIWLMTPGAGRGHVVAYNRFNGTFFDANFGVYTAQNDIHVEVASFIDVHYRIPGTYTHFQIFSLDL